MKIKASDLNQNLYRFLIIGEPVENLIKIINELNPDNNDWYMEVLDDSCDDIGALSGECIKKIEDIKWAFDKVDPTLVTLSFKKDGNNVYFASRFSVNNDLIVCCGDDLKEFFEEISDSDYPLARN